VIAQLRLAAGELTSILRLIESQVEITFPEAS